MRALTEVKGRLSPSRLAVQIASVFEVWEILSWLACYHCVSSWLDAWRGSRNVVLWKARFKSSKDPRGDPWQ